MSEKSRNLPDKKRIYCNSCENETNHILKGEHSSRFYEEDDGRLLYWEDIIYRFWICAGCDQGTLEYCYTMDNMVDQYDNQIYDYTYHPSRKQQHIPLKSFRNLPKKLNGLYKESIDAYNNKLLILCAGGLRALIEGICVDKKISGSNLLKKIDALTSILPKNIVENLHSFRFMGNEALHELNPPNRRNLKLAIEVSEDLMNFLYELDYKASQLKKEQSKKVT
ncbi:DUF4145 domain-containing protein [Desulfobacula toluolica]|uniref:Conserved uncharacterized protein n=1 Tax=Desulfobacula toluolica (strain DSM 7467 / Tol2) TaxID=651182 RepID=K0NID1_DESTT|nr:DUF4145 domain-containing protein [Desulfobacula toluolica]CCK81146.1 conserved uncharacterized protein [Desulfobacula toluolica Tol2]